MDQTAKPGAKRKRTALAPWNGEAATFFADLGLPHPEIALAKAELVQRIRQVIADQKLTQIQSAKLLGIDQPKVSALLRGRVDNYTLDRLMRYLTLLGQRIEISVRGPGRKPSAEPGLRVVLA